MEGLKALSSLHNCSAELKKSSRFRAIFQSNRYMLVSLEMLVGFGAEAQQGVPLACPGRHPGESIQGAAQVRVLRNQSQQLIFQQMCEICDYLHLE